MRARTARTPSGPSNRTANPNMPHEVAYPNAPRASQRGSLVCVANHPAPATHPQPKGLLETRSATPRTDRSRWEVKTLPR